jgi:N-acetylmuramoyl-L-alanine amidase
MPYVFLSPSTQEWNNYINGGTEEEYMNIIADRMEPYLRSSGIQFTRNIPERNVNSAINDSNSGKYDVHFAIHSNAAPDEYKGLLRGIDIYYSPLSIYSERLASTVANNIETIYPLPEKVRIMPTTSLGEVTMTRAVAVLCEIGYHDNTEDEQWIKNNLSKIAKNLVISLCDYFGIPFINAGKIYRATVLTDGSGLNIRRFPAVYSQIIGSIPNNAQITIYGKTGDWCVAEYQNIVGYVRSDFILE